MEEVRSLTVTEVDQAASRSFIGQIQRAREAAEKLLSDPEAGPWAGCEFTEAIQAEAGTSHDPAMYVEDELIRRGRLRTRAGQLVVAHGETPPVVH